MQSFALFLIVHYGDTKVTLRLLESLATLSLIHQLDVLVVNNDPEKDLNAQLFSVASLPNLLSMKSQANLGYFGGAKAGIDYYLERRGGLPTWIVIANNDIIVDDRSFLEKLISCDSQQVGILAPRILSARTGSDQNPFMRKRPGPWRMAELRFWLSNYKLAAFHETLSSCKRAFRGLANVAALGLKKSPARQELIYAPHGSFLVLSRRYFECGGSLDHGAFLYGEELTVAENCRRIGLPVLYDPELVVLHNEHTTTGTKFSHASYERNRQAFEYFKTFYLAESS